MNESFNDVKPNTCGYGALEFVCVISLPKVLFVLGLLAVLGKSETPKSKGKNPRIISPSGDFVKGAVIFLNVELYSVISNKEPTLGSVLLYYIFFEI